MGDLPANPCPRLNAEFPDSLPATGHRRHRRDGDEFDVAQAAGAITGRPEGFRAAHRAGGRVSRRVMSVMDAQVMSDSLTCGSRSRSRQCRRARMIHDVGSAARRGARRGGSFSARPPAEPDVTVSGPKRAGTCWRRCVAAKFTRGLDGYIGHRALVLPPPHGHEARPGSAGDGPDDLHRRLPGAAPVVDRPRPRHTAALSPAATSAPGSPALLSRTRSATPASEPTPPPRRRPRPPPHPPITATSRARRPPLPTPSTTQAGPPP